MKSLKHYKHKIFMKDWILGFSKNAGVSSREGQMVFGKEFEFERFLF